MAEQVRLELQASEETLKAYPYRFKLEISYVLAGSTIHVIWGVENKDTQEMHFQIGGHPAFNVPGGKLEGRIVLDNKEPMVALKGYPDASHEMVEVPLEAEKGVLDICEDFFRNDSVKIPNCQTHQAVLLDTNGEPAVTVDYKAPVCAFWSPYGKHAPFVCIEPWYGIGDPRGFHGEFKDKPLMNHLLPGASFLSEYTIKIG